jgi:hypothetical protein
MASDYARAAPTNRIHAEHHHIERKNDGEEQEIVVG